MHARRAPLFDHTPGLLLEGYGWLPNRRREAGGEMVRTRLLGQPAVGLCGPEAARFCYGEEHLRRHGVAPEPVLGTLFGKGGVQSLDGDHHRHRKAMFLSLLTGPGAGVAALAERAGAAWDQAVPGWAGRPRIVLFDEASRVLTRVVCEWTGIPLPEPESDRAAADMVALVDGFGSLEPRHWRARRARGRQERWLTRLVEQVRRGEAAAPAGSALATIAGYREPDGAALDPKVAAVELLNVVRPAVAVCWYVAFAGHALHRWPEHRKRLRDGDAAFAEAFTHELRRFYPFAPFLGARAATDLSWDGEPIAAGNLVLLDVYGQHHDPRWWPDPYVFSPARFADRTIGPFELIPQGGGDPRTGHRCPGEEITIALLRTLALRLAQLDYQVPAQDLGIPLGRIPTRPRSRVVLEVAARTG